MVIGILSEFQRLDLVKLFLNSKLIMGRLHLKCVTIGVIFGSSMYKLWTLYYEKFVKSKDLDVDCMFFTPKQVICSSTCAVSKKAIQNNMKVSNPCNNCSLKKLISVINSAKFQLDICMYLITYEEICKTIIKLFKSGINIRIIMDKQMSDEAIGTKVLIFRQEYIPIKIIQSYFMMHNKFAVIDKEVVVTGSMNWTKQGVTGIKTSKLNVASVNAVSKIVPPKIFTKNLELHENTNLVKSNKYSSKNTNSSRRICNSPEKNISHFETKAKTKNVLLDSKNDAPFTTLGFEQSKSKITENIVEKKSDKQKSNDAVLPHHTICLPFKNIKDKKLSSADKSNAISIHSRINHTFPKVESVHSHQQCVNFEGLPEKSREHDIDKHIRMELYEHFHFEEHSREVKKMKSENHFIPVDMHVVIPNKERSGNCVMDKFHEKHDDKMENAFKKYLATDHGGKEIYSEESDLSSLLSIEEKSYQLQQKDADNFKLYENSVDSDYSIIQNEFSKCLSQKINPADEEDYLEKMILKDLTNSELSLCRTYRIINITDLANNSSIKLLVPEPGENNDLDEILEKRLQNEELFNSIEEIKNDFQPETKDTCDKTDVFFHSDKEFGNITTKVIDNIVKKQSETICKNENEKIIKRKAENKGMCDMNVTDKKIENEVKVNEKVFEKKVIKKNIKDIDHTIINLTHNTMRKTVNNTKIKQSVKYLKKNSENRKVQNATSDSKLRDMIKELNMKRTHEQVLTRSTKEEFTPKYVTSYRRSTQEQMQRSPEKSEQNARLKKEFEDLNLEEIIDEYEAEITQDEKRKMKSKQDAGEMRLVHEVLEIQESNIIPKSMKMSEKQKMKKDFKHSEILFEELNSEKIKEQHEREKSVEKFKLNSIHEEMETEKENAKHTMEKNGRVKPEQYLDAVDTVDKVELKEIKQKKKVMETPTKSDVIEKLSTKSGDSAHSDGTKDTVIEITGAMNIEIPMPASVKSSLELFDVEFFNTNDKLCFTGKAEEAKLINFEIDNLILYQPYEDQMLLYDIANCAATQAYLMMCNLNFDIEYRKNAEQMSPSGKVPFISSGLCIVSEFEPIVSLMQYKKFACVRTAEYDKSAFRKLISMVVNTLEVAERYICWLNEETLINYTTQKIGMYHPFPLNHILKWKRKYEERKLLCEQGVQGKSLDIILKEINSCFKNLSHHLGNNNFFFGTATELDALVYGHIYALSSVKQEGPIREIQSILLQYPNLLSFAINFEKSFSLSKVSNIDVFCVGHKAKKSATSLH